MFTNIFKGIGNHDYEMGRILWFLGGFFMIGYQGYAIYAGQNFGPIEFGTGFGALLAAGGLGIAAKDKALPENRSVKVATVQGDINTENVSVQPN